MHDRESDASAAAATASRTARRTRVPTLTYRPDFDGMRGIGLFAIVAYHAGITVGGSFVFLDLFFAISGFLISWQLVTAMQSGKFSFWEFYARRVRRLLPAALVTIAVTVVLFAVLLPPYATAEASSEGAWASSSLANLFSANHAGYWSVQSINEPFLHMWSLSAEEQFYVVWPVTVLILMTLFHRRAWIPVLVLTVASVVFTAVATPIWPHEAYLLVHFRIYEFSFGALAVWVAHIDWGRRARLAMWIAGVLMLLGAFLAFDESMPYPSVLALAPAVGSMLIILSNLDFGPHKVITNRVAVRAGQLSYSVYLVHWPILVLANALTGGLSWPVVMVCVALMWVAGEALYRFVEKPLRIHQAGDRSAERQQPGPSRFVRLAGPVLAGVVVLTAGCLAVHHWSSSPARYSADARPLLKLAKGEVQQSRLANSRRICKGERVSPSICGQIVPDHHNVLIVGDSLAVDTLNLTLAADRESNLLISSMSGCQPFAKLDHYFPRCAHFNKRRLAEINRLLPQVDEVRLGVGFVPGDTDELVALIHRLRGRGVAVSLLGLGPEYGQPAWQLVAHGGLSDADTVLSKAATVSAAENAAVRRKVEAAGATYIDRLATICHSGRCTAFVGDELLIFDSAHLTPGGASWLGPRLAPLNSQATTL
jgi:peptidoglycan/LPS O-acetylase OafA/YrhL